MTNKMSKTDSTGESFDQPENDATPWLITVGTKRGDIVTAYERPDKKNVIYLRWTDPVSGTYARRATGIMIRDVNGRRIQARIARAVKQAEEQQQEIRQQRHDLRNTEVDVPNELAGTEHTRPALPSQLHKKVSEPATTSSRRDAIEMTLMTGIATALRVGTGIFAIATNHARDTARSLERVLTVLDGNMLIGDMTSGTYRHLWRMLAQLFAQECRMLEAQRDDARRVGNLELLHTLQRRRPSGGFRATEMAVISLLHVCKWLGDEHRVTLGTAGAPSKWRKEMAADWQRIVPLQFQQPNRGASGSVSPRRTTRDAVEEEREDATRYTAAEAGRLLIALPRADPRLRHAFELAGEGRLGQLTRTRRSDLKLAAGAGIMGLGFYQVEGRGTKPGFDVDLDEVQRALTDNVLNSGYLADLEVGYRTGSVSDYWLFPGGRLVVGRSRDDVQVPMDERTLNDLWLQLEVLADVPHFVGRGHYGYRRLATDIAEDFEGDERVLNALFGHTPKGTRRSVYQKRRRDEVVRRVTELRRRVRDHCIATATAAGFSFSDVPEPKPLAVPVELRRGPKPRKGYRGWRKPEEGEV